MNRFEHASNDFASHCERTASTRSEAKGCNAVSRMRECHAPCGRVPAAVPDSPCFAEYVDSTIAFNGYDGPRPVVQDDAETTRMDCAKA
jgi:hypothetical protein